MRQRPPPTEMRRGYRFLRYLCQIGYVTFFHGRVYGTRHVPRTGGVLLVCNHQSYLDPVLATLAIDRECDYMARDTLFANPRFRALIEYLNAFAVKRDTADLGAIKETLRRLRDGRLVVTFPEATRTHDGSIGPLRGGVVLLARKARVPIVPTVILGAYQAWPRTARWPRPHPVVVAYDAPVVPHKHPGLSDDDLVALIRDRIVALHDRYARCGPLR